MASFLEDLIGNRQSFNDCASLTSTISSNSSILLEVDQHDYQATQDMFAGINMMSETGTSFDMIATGSQQAFQQPPNFNNQYDPMKGLVSLCHRIHQN